MTSTAYSNWPRRKPGRCSSVSTLPARPPAERKLKSERLPVPTPPCRNAPNSQGSVAMAALAGESSGDVLVCADAFRTAVTSRALRRQKVFIRESSFSAKERPPAAAARLIRQAALTGDLFELLRVHVEVRVDVLHVVIIFQRFQQPNALCGGRAFEFRVRRSDHRYLGQDRLNPCLLHGFRDCLPGVGLGDDLPRIAFVV